jgi:hypothetical protein
MEPVDSPVERHQLVFLNPDLSGLFAAHLARRAGADIAVIDERRQWKKSTDDFPVAFPSGGTYFPREVDLMATEAGFPPPLWETIPHLVLNLPDRRITINAEDGPGGLLLSLVESFKGGKIRLSEWLQEQLAKAETMLNSPDGSRIAPLSSVVRSVAAEIRALGHPEQLSVCHLFNMLSIAVLGRGIIQLDIRNFPLVLAGILSGWSAPAPGERGWGEILAHRLQREGARWHEVSSVTNVQSFGRRSSVVRGSDGSLFAARILVVPENDRFHHPVSNVGLNIIKWRTWTGCCADKIPGLPILGLIQTDPKRPPVNDALLAYHIRPDMRGLFTVSAPVEDRYLKKDAHTRLETLTSRIKFLLANRFNWKIEHLEGPGSEPEADPINLPGTASAVSYPEGPLWGDDVLARLRAADRLSKRVLGRLR